MLALKLLTEIKEIISTKKVDPNKELTSEINLILKEYIISLMKPLENSSFFKKKKNLMRLWYLVLMALEKQQV